MSGNRTTPAPASAVTDALLIEVFSSVQGEGVLVGYRQIFVRLAGCNLACAYCDTAFQPTESFLVEETPGAMVFTAQPNPVSAAGICALVSRWQQQLPHHSLSLTGGEPLVQEEALRSWLPPLATLLPIYLETNGTLPDRLPPLLPHLAWIAMDIKLESLTGQATPWEEHRRFLRLSAQTGCQVKIVVGARTEREEIEQAAALVREIAPQVPLILQPVSGEFARCTAERLLQLQGWALLRHGDVRVIPQTHRFLGLQ